MLRLAVIVVCPIVFTILGLAAGLAIVTNLPDNFHDSEGVATTLMVMCPTVGGFVAGLVVGLLGIFVALPPRKG
jgi:hypothetical protein